MNLETVTPSPRSSQKPQSSQAGGSIVKKLAKIFGVLIGLFLVTAIVVPLVVDVDKYRPQILTAANQNINGKLELGKLSLSLWGQIRIEIAGLSLSDAQGRKVVSVENAFFHLPFISILSGSPELTLKMKSPEVNIVKDKTGKMNVMTLTKPSAAAPAAPTGTTTTQPAAPTSSGATQVALPGIAARARLGIELTHAKVHYQDAMSGTTTQIDDLNLLMHNVSLSHPMDLEFWVDDLNTHVGKTIAVTGPVRARLKAQSKLLGGIVGGASMTLLVDLDKLAISMPGVFEKKAGVTARAEGELEMTSSELKITSLDIKFFNAVIRTVGTVSHLGEPTGPVVNLAVKSNQIELAPWSQLLPSLASFELGGSASLDATATGPSNKLGYKAGLVIKDLTAKAPSLKEQPHFDGEIHVVTDAIERFSVTMKAPENDLTLTGKLISFSHPQLQADVVSNSLNLDKLMDLKPPAAAKAGSAKGGEAKSESGAAATSSGAGVAGGGADYDALLNPLRENPMLVAFTAAVGVNMHKIQVYGIPITETRAHFSMKDLGASIDNFQTNVFGGSILATARTQLKPKTPSYAFNANVTGLDLQKAVDSQLHLFANTFWGKAFFKATGTGSSFNPPAAMSHLNASGNFKVENAKFASIDVGKMASDALGSALAKLGDKVPGLKGKTLKIGPKESKYDYISTSFTVAGGKFSAPDFVGKAAPNSGIDMKGYTNVGLIDKALNARFELSDTYNFTKAKDLSINQGGVQIDHVLAEGNGPVKFPVTVGCTLNAPCYTYGEVPEYLAKVAMGNLSKGVQSKAKSEVQKALGKQAAPLLKNAPAGVQNQLNKLFGH